MAESLMYQMIADIDELRWFFEHVIERPTINESYSAVFACRQKKLTKEEKETLGFSRKESEFLATQTFRLDKIKDGYNIDEASIWTFDNFLKRLRRFNVDRYAYITEKGNPIPEKSLVVMFYVNPCDNLKIANALVEQISTTKTAICKAALNGKDVASFMQSYQLFGNLENNLKHFRASQKGNVYWLDFDIDVPSWFKSNDKEYFNKLCELFTTTYGKGNYVIIDTSGGYHILVRTSSIKQNPHNTCRSVDEIYKLGVDNGEDPYIDEDGNLKFECIINDSQIPGIPLPGTFQYERPVTILNKEEFMESNL